MDILIERMRSGSTVDAQWVESLLRQRNREERSADRRIAKKRLLPYYLAARKEQGSDWESWHLTEDEHSQIVELLRAKPRRTASGVATVTVLTKPWPCSSDCVYCPNDVRMPKSYMSDEPACQRAERCCFDPYLQVASRLRTLADMGHVVDKVELIVLGGTWSDYPREYQVWFASQLFKALNEFGTPEGDAEYERRRKRLALDPVPSYEGGHVPANAVGRAPDILSVQASVDEGLLTYNEALACFGDRYPMVLDDPVDEACLALLQRKNESAACRAVGLVVETQPEKVDVTTLVDLRKMGCTKVQMGIQSLDDRILHLNERSSTVQDIARALRLLRLFGFKTHVHMMLNLLGSDPKEDVDQYRMLVEDERFKPDEVKLYPCALVASSRLGMYYESGRWQPYSEEELLSVLAEQVLLTPPYMRISRMIRDISSKDILVGNKKTNLRQLVEAEVGAREDVANEMRIREIACDDVDEDALSLETVRYETDATSEVFLQWVTQGGRLAAFLRLSLPQEKAMDELRSHLDIDAFDPHDAMIREVHVYGRVSAMHESKEGSQHRGLGRQLIEAAKQLARDAGYEGVKVISAVGTRDYYRALGFTDAGLYQRASLIAFKSE